MRQQINLYQPIFRQERKLFSAAVVGVTLGIVCVALASLWVFGATKVSRLEREVASMRAQLQNQEQMTITTGQIRSTRAKPTDVQARIAQLSQELAERTQALELLRGGAAGEIGGFAARLTALARQHIDGLWIDHLVLGGSAGSMSLGGRTVAASLVPQYLKRLASESALRGTRFEEFRIERPADDPTAASLHFEAISSKALTGEDRP